MARKKNTNLKLADIKKLAKENTQLETHTFDDGSTLQFYPTFPATLLEKMFEQIQHSFKNAPSEIELTENFRHKFIVYMCIRTFTHLSEQFKGTTLQEQLNEMESLINSGYYKIITEEVFSPKEIDKVFDQLKTYGSNILFLDRLTQKMHEEVSNLELKNKDIINSVNLNRKLQ
jgi:hypothetical protein